LPKALHGKSRAFDQHAVVGKNGFGSEIGPWAGGLLAPFAAAQLDWFCRSPPPVSSRDTWSIESTIQAIVCELLPMSGAGMSSPGR